MTGPGKRLSALPEYAVAEIAALKRRLVAEGADIIDVGAGDADFHPPSVAVETLYSALSDSAMSRYSFQVGLPEFRDEVAAYMRRRFNVRLDSSSEVLPLLGSKDGLAHFALSVLDPGDVCLVPEPGYPAYVGGAVFAGAEIHVVPLEADKGFLVELGELPEQVLKRARLVFLNYPNNPTSAIAPIDYLQRTVEICRQNSIAIAYDNPYAELTYDGYVAPSILEVDGAREVAVEFHSFSKSYGMTGWRLGFAVGNTRLVGALTRAKSYFDTGPFLAIQKAGAAVLRESESCLRPVRSELERRRDCLVNAMKAKGFEVEAPAATMYLWVRLPDGMESARFAKDLLVKDGLAVLAGSALGPAGEGFVRFAFTVGPERLGEAADRFAGAIARWQAASARS